MNLIASLWAIAIANQFNPEEADDWKWIDLKVLQADIQKIPNPIIIGHDCCDRLLLN
jgi:hypothetical protein